MKTSSILDILYQLYPLVAAILGMCIAQVLKTLLEYIKQGEMNIKVLTTAGGMPSAHSAMVSALSTAVGLQDGWTSSTFCICVTLSLVILYDAAGIRSAAGKQAKILNQMIEDLFEKGQFKAKRLTELLGHTPLEVVIGVLLGIGIAFTLYY